MNAPTDPLVLELPHFRLERGGVLDPARLVYRTHGDLAPDRGNAVLLPTWFAGDHTSHEWLIGPGRPLDTDRYFVIVPNLFGNGLSSSPSNTPAPQAGADFPHVTMGDNVRAQHELVRLHFGIERLALVIGCSMGAQQTYQWAVSYPDMVARALPFCGSPKTSPHNGVFIEGLRAVLTTDPEWHRGRRAPGHAAGLRAFSRVYAGWGFSQAFYWNERYRSLGFDSVDEFLAGFWEPNFAGQDTNDLLAMLWTWQHADVGATGGAGGDVAKALGTITARTLAMPAERDLYFPPEDEVRASAHIPDAEVRVIPGEWGHLAGSGANPDDVAFIGRSVRELLASPADGPRALGSRPGTG
ncbi:alpha/beta fold hydrolase [Streptomyces sp. NPDC060184]|uniref:alpha/beta fold hydrolase n=1 Tax=Streptomyces sp. NPDC060184 TaxID=3347064 RepID=UPI00365CD82D